MTSGKYYEMTKLPLPLGVDVVRTDLGPDLMRKLQRVLRDSIDYGLKNRTAALDYAIGNVRELVQSDVPMFGICLGHQILGLAVGGETFKLKFGHRGANHPVKKLATGKIEITSQNHGFAVDPTSLPPDVEVTHLNLYDGTVEGLRHKSQPVFCVQYHPEASPGPHDADYLFDDFLKLIEEKG